MIWGWCLQAGEENCTENHSALQLTHLFISYRELIKEQHSDWPLDWWVHSTDKIWTTQVSPQVHFIGVFSTKELFFFMESFCGWERSRMLQTAKCCCCCERVCNTKCSCSRHLALVAKTLLGRPTSHFAVPEFCPSSSPDSSFLLGALKLCGRFGKSAG